MKNISDVIPADDEEARQRMAALTQWYKDRRITNVIAQGAAAREQGAIKMRTKVLLKSENIQ